MSIARQMSGGSKLQAARTQIKGPKPEICLHVSEITRRSVWLEQNEPFGEWQKMRSECLWDAELYIAFSDTVRTLAVSHLRI